MAQAKVNSPKHKGRSHGQLAPARYVNAKTSLLVLGGFFLFHVDRLKRPRAEQAGCRDVAEPE